MADWQTTTGKVLTSGVAQTVLSDGRVRFVPEVTYEYDVGGATHTGQRFSETIATGAEHWAQAQADQYPSGSTVTVHYRADDPGYAVLEKGVGKAAGRTLVLVLLIIAGASLAVPICLLLFGQQLLEALGGG